jgi:hypothetical protein
MRVAIRASLARTGEDLGLALRRALADGLARRMRQRPDGDAAGGDLAEGRAGARSAEGRRETEAIGHAVRGLLDDADLALAAHTLVSLRHRRTVSRREAKTGFIVAEMAFRAVVE